jgi:MFS family permease
MGYTSMGVTLGPALGPVIGGLLDQFLGWRSIFWFLAILCGIMLVLMLCFLPETSRSVVGNGTIRPQKWNASIHDILRWREQRKLKVLITEEPMSLTQRKRGPSPFDAIVIAGEKQDGMILIFGALIYAAFFGILSSLPSRLQAEYSFSSLQIGLCYLPYGLGSLTSRWTVGTLMDWNFRRHAHKRGIPIVKNRQQQLATFPIELARLQIALPLVYAASCFILAYGWVMDYHTSLAGPLITLFFVGHTATGAVSCLGTLIIDCNVKSPATAQAASQLIRCLFGAGAVACAVPIINRIGMGWTGTFVAGLWVICSPMLWAVMIWGSQWREDKRQRIEREEAEGGRSRKACSFWRRL